MFSSFKKKVSSAIKEGRTISENLSNTYIRQQSSPSSSTSSSSYRLDHAIPTITTGDFLASQSGHVLVSAGCEYLAQQEQTWKELHTATEWNAIEAERIDEQIKKLRSTSDQVATHLSDLNHSLACIPEINRQLIKCTEMFRSIGNECGRVQQSLFELEDLLEVLDMQERQLNKKFEMAMHREKKMAELEKVRQQLAGRHETNVRQYEQQLRQVQQERQAVFQDAFQEDLRNYQTHGSIPKVEHLIVDRSTAPQVTLEEIVLDTRDDSRQLDDFLNN